MDKCKYYLTDNGIRLTLNSDLELTEFIKNNYSETDKRLKYSKVGSGQLTKAEQVLQTINKNNPSFDTNSSSILTAYELLREKHDLNGVGVEEYLSPDLIEDNYIEKDYKLLLSMK